MWSSGGFYFLRGIGREGIGEGEVRERDKRNDALLVWPLVNRRDCL